MKSADLFISDVIFAMSTDSNVDYVHDVIFDNS